MLPIYVPFLILDICSQEVNHSETLIKEKNYSYHLWEHSKQQYLFFPIKENI